MKLEDARQNIVDLAHEFADNYLKEKEGIVEGEGEYEKDGYIFRYQVYRQKDESEFEKKLKEKQGKKNIVMTPFAMAVHWNKLYQKKFGMDYSVEPTAKDMRIFKQLLAEFNAEKLKDLLLWYIEHCKELPMHSAMPSLEGFFHYKRDVAFKVMEENQGKSGAGPVDKKEDKKLGVKFT